MTPQIEEFERFVDLSGGNRQAAERLDISDAMVRHIRTGRRSVSPALALKIFRLTKGEISPIRLIWGESLQ